MRVALVILVVLVIVAVIFGGMYVGRRNTMVQKEETVQTAWSQVDVVLQRRADLIPNLVETVKGFASQEQQVFADIAAARAAMGGARTPEQRIAANNQLDSALSRLLVVVENYPQLRSNENFLRLQDELSGTENRIAVERRRYNETVQDYNTYIRQFPNNIIAGMSGFERNDARFEASEGSREAPRVQFPESTQQQRQRQGAPQTAPAPAQ